jgi:hypothetical protein
MARLLQWRFLQLRSARQPGQARVFGDQPKPRRSGLYLGASRHLDDVGWRRPDQALDMP